MWVTHRALLSRPDLSRQELLEAVCPPSMKNSTPGGEGGHAKMSLSALEEFGFVRQDDNGLLQAEHVQDAHEFIRQLRRRIVVDPSERLPDLVGAPDLRAGLVWLMRASPIQPLSWKDNVETELTPPGLFTNDTRWNSFRLWSGLLGFSQSAPVELDPLGRRNRIVPNPTPAVLDAILRPFGPQLPVNEQISIARLLAHLRSEIPILPGHPSAVYEDMPVSDDNVGPALALALISAEHRGILKLQYQSDATGTPLPDPTDSKNRRYVSSVTIGVQGQ